MTVHSGRILNVVKSKKTFKRFLASKLRRVSVKAVPLPKTIDLRASWWKIADQGQTGSCVGQALSAVLRYHFVQVTKLPTTQTFSARFIWTASREMDAIRDLPTTMIEGEGTTLTQALEIAKRHGCVPETTLPFYGILGYSGTTDEFYSIAKSYRISNYYELNHRNILQMKTWLATRGPIFCSLICNEEFMNCRKSNPYLKDLNGSDLGGHAVVIVGYRDDGTFILRNSWGTQWGDGGYAYLSEDYVIRRLQESYGVIV